MKQRKWGGKTKFRAVLEVIKGKHSQFFLALMESITASGGVATLFPEISLDIGYFGEKLVISAYSSNLENM